MGEPTRCAWATGMRNPTYLAYHDHEWGFPEHDDRMLFELLILEGFQAGLSWECILNKRENFRKAFDNFDVDTVAAYDEAKCQQLAQDPGIVRNRLKIHAAVANAQAVQAIKREMGSLDAYVWSFTDGGAIDEDRRLYTSTPLSDRVSKDMKKRGMKFVGTTIIYSYLQATGVINGHQPDCRFNPHRAAAQHPADGGNPAAVQHAAEDGNLAGAQRAADSGNSAPAQHPTENENPS